MMQSEAINNYSREAIESFVQTVVFVDDRIYATDAKIIEPKTIATPPGRKPTRRGQEKSSNNNNEDDALDIIADKNYSPHDIQASFAKKGIVCSLHQPDKKTSVGTQSVTYKLCAAADIVVVDWDLYGDSDERAQELIRNIVSRSLKDSPHQLRLVLVYTDDPNLFAVSDILSQYLDPEGEFIYPKGDECLAFHSDNARVAVLGKPGHRGPKYQNIEVKESALAERTIAEFGKLADGLLQGSVLKGLAEIRRQSRRILMKFHSGLDGAFLSHRASGLPHEEALHRIVPLLIAEIESVLEDGMPTPVIGKDVIDSWCDSKWIPSQGANDFVGETADVREFAKVFSSKGMGISQDYDRGNNTGLGKTIKSLENRSPKWPTDDRLFQALTTVLSKNSDGNDLRELASLMSMRTYYGDLHQLRLGTIIGTMSETPRRYLLCLQPLCDSVRLTGTTSFIFCALKESSGRKASLMIESKNGYVKLNYKPKVKDALTLKFSPSQEVIIAKNRDIKPIFTDDENCEYEWLAQMKPSHAQRAAETFAKELGRVGLTESEWLRLRSK